MLQPTTAILRLQLLAYCLQLKNVDLHGVAAVPVDWRQADSIHKSHRDSQQHDRNDDDDVTHDVTSRHVSAAPL